MRREKTKERYEWLVVQRSKKTGNPVRTISLDAETDAILSEIKGSISEWIREAIKEKAGRQAGVITLNVAEEDVYSVMWTFFSQLSYKGERFPDVADEKLTTEILDFVHEHISTRIESEEWNSPLYALKLVEKARKDKEFWNELYSRMRITYLRDLKHSRGKLLV